MVSSINLGGFSTVNGKNILSGSASGIDTKGLVEALSTAKRLPAVKLEETISKNKDKITALTQMKDLLTKLKTSLDSLRNPPFGSTATNAFSARSPFLSMTGGKTVSDYVGVTTDSGAPIGKFSLKVNTLAKAETRQSSAFTDRTSSIVEASGSNTTGKFSAGTFQINGQNVTFQEDATLNDVASAINSVSNKSGVTASVVKFSDTDYRLVMASKNTGAANGIVISDPDSVFPVAPASTIMTVTQPPLDAEIEFNGEIVTRSSNKITDLVDKVTLSLYQETGVDQITLDIDKNNQAIAESIGGFVDSYNEVRVFSSKQEQRDSDGNLLKTSVLNNDPTMQTMLNKMALFVTGQVSVAIPTLYSNGGNSVPTRLGDLGINLTDFVGDSSNPDDIIPATNNILQLDANKLNTQLETYFDSAKNIFEFNFTSSSASLGVYKRDNAVAESKLKIDIDTSRPVGQQAQLVGIDGSNLVSAVNLQLKTTTAATSVNFASASASAVNAAGTDTAGAFAAGTFQINGQNVVIEEGDSLQDIATAINGTTTLSGARATIVNSEGQYKLVVTGTAEGTNGVVINDPDGVIPTSGMFTNDNKVTRVSGAPGGDLADFTYNYTGDGTDVVERPANLTAKDITLKIDTGAADPDNRAVVTKIFGSELVDPIKMKYVPGSISSSVEGLSGTQFAGLSMIYTGDGTDEINISMQQGIADKMFNSLNDMLDGIGDAEGLIETAISNLQKSNDTLQASVDKIDVQIVSYREKMLDKFSALEAAVASANSLLQLLGAQAEARNNS